MASVLAVGPIAAGKAATGHDEARGAGVAKPAYALASRCYVLRSRMLDRLVVKRGDGTYAATAERSHDAERFRMKATDLGDYLLYGRAKDFLIAASQNDVVSAGSPSDAAVWAIDSHGGGSFTLTSPETGKVLAVSPDSGELVLADESGAGSSARFTFKRARACARYPEAEVNARGNPFRGTARNGEVRGFLDMHVHLTYFEAIGGMFHCGRPWHPFGVAYALPDCAETEGPQGSAAPVQNFVNYGEPEHPHDTRGWPTFKDWPKSFRKTDEQMYYRWLERAWRGGLRLMVPMATDNAVLCEIYPRRKYDCDEMDSVRRQIDDAYELQDYIDAQSGGPGKGWFRIVKSPQEARRLIKRGKLAVVLAIETSRPFGCRVLNDVPQCDERQVAEGLDEVYKVGVRDMLILNKFDDAFAGVNGDGGATGVVVNTGNFLETGHFWSMQTCTGPAEDTTQETHTDVGVALQGALAPGAVPVYPPPPHCNTRGLSNLGNYVIRRMMQRGMMISVDHLSALARSQALDQIQASHYPGVVSDHSWADVLTYPRVYRLGGVATPYGGYNPPDFVKIWRDARNVRRKGRFFGFGYGADTHGLAGQADPIESIDGAPPVHYPFRSFDGGVRLDRLRTGERVFDINTDGVANYGLYPDWIEDLRLIGGDQIVRDMSRGAEMYLRTWARAIDRSRRLR